MPHSSHAAAPPPTLLPRVLALLVCLAFAKLYLLLSATSDYYQAHWRTRQVPDVTDLDGWFPALAILIAATLALASRAAEQASRRHVRFTALAVAGIISVTWLLTLSKVDRSYLYPLVRGTLKPGALLDNLAVDLFFNPPYASLYFLALISAWVALARRNQERWVFAVMGGLCATYLLVNRPQFGEAAIFAWLAVAIGLSGLLAFRLSLKPQGLWFYPGSVALMLFLLWILGRHDDKIFTLEPSLFLVLCLGCALFVPTHIALRHTTGLNRLTHLLPFGFTVFLLLGAAHNPHSVNYRHVFLLGLAFPEYLLGEVLALALIWVALQPIARRWPAGGRRAFDAVAVLVILISVADIEWFKRAGMRLDWSVLTMSDDPVFLGRTLRPFLIPASAVVASVAGGYAALTRLTKLRFRAEGSTPLHRDGSFLLASSAALLITVRSLLVAEQPDIIRPSVFGNILSTTPLAQSWKVRRLGPAEFAAQWTALGLPDPTAAATPRRASARPHPLNVVLILLESAYNPYLSLFGGADETQPLLKRYQERMELFPNFHSSFANSMHARFATFNAIAPPSRYITYLNPHIQAPSLFEILRREGCSVSLYYSSSRRYTRFADYLSGRGVEVLCDCDSMPGATAADRVSWGIQESATLDAVERQLDDYAATQQRFFLTYIPAAPHMPYDLPTKQFGRFEEGVPPLTGDYSGPYKNSLLYMDWVVSSILEHLEQTGLLDRTLVVITSDHGEMLGDRNNQLGHGWNLEPWITNVPLVLMDPDHRGCRTNFVRASQVDILPTILDRLGIPLPEQQFYQGAALDRLAPDSLRTILLNSHHQKAIIRGDRYYLYDPTASRAGNENPHIRVFDLQNDGVRQVATETNTAPAFAEPLRQLDAFQESLVTHYSRYRDWLTSSNLQFKAAFPRKLASNTAF